MMPGCPKCCKMMGALLLVLGLGFLLVDLGQWTMWGVNWWTAAFLLMGLCKVAKTSCKDCQKMCKKR